MIDDIRYTTVTVANGASLSGAAQLLPTNGRLVGVITDAGWDTNAMTFQVSVDGGTTYVNLYNAGTEYSMAGIVASTYNAINPDVFAGARHLKVRSGTSAAAVNQVGDTVVTLVMRQI
jgi:hypothetical protein